VFTILFLLVVIAVPSVLGVTVTVQNQPSEARITLTYSDPVTIVEIVLDHPNNEGHQASFSLEPEDVGTAAAKEHVYTNSEPLLPGMYLLHVVAQSPTGTLIADSPQFVIEGIQLELLAPRCGVSPKQTDVLRFRTVRNVSGTITPVPTYCQYAGVFDPSDSSLTATHAVTLAFSGSMDVACSQTKTGGSLGGQQGTASWTLAVDSTKPTVQNVTQTPLLVTNAADPLVQIAFTTSDPSACRIRPAGGEWRDIESVAACGDYATEHVTDATGFDTADRSLRDYLYELECVNLAQHVSNMTFNITTNFGDGVLLRKVGPDDALSASDAFPITLMVKPILVDPLLAPEGACSVNADDAASCSAMAADTAHAMTQETDPSASPEISEHDIVFTAQFTKGVGGFSEGENNLRVRCCLLKDGKTLDTRRNFTILLDSVPPTAPRITTTGAVCGATLNAKVASSDQGGIARYAYRVTYDGQVIAEDNTTLSVVTIPAPAAPYDEASLLWEITAVDNAGNEMQSDATVTLHAGTEEECTNIPFITLASPTPLGFARSQPYDFSVSTKRASTCSYGVYGTDETRFARFPTTGGLMHTATRLVVPDVRMGIVCKEGSVSGTGAVHRAEFLIGYRTAPPVIDVWTSHDVVRDRTDAIVVLKAKTDVLTQCSITGRGASGLFDNEESLNRSLQESYLGEHVIALRFDDIETDETQRFTYLVTCKDLAQQDASMTKPIIVDFGATMSIDVVAPVPPYVATSATTVSIQPDRAATCTWQAKDADILDFDTVDDGVHSVQLQQLKDGSQDIIVACQSSDLRQHGTRNVQFTVDTKPPVIEELSGQNILCGAESFVARIATLDPAPVLEYQLDNGSVGASFQTTLANGSIIAIDPTGMPFGEYQLRVIAKNRANISSVPYVRTIMVASPVSEVCTRPSHCRNVEKDADETGIDCGGASCRTCVACGQIPCPSGTTCTCTGGDTCVDGVCVYIDNVAPSAPSITANATICDGIVRARFNATDASGIKAYNYTLQDDVRIIARAQSVSGVVQVAAGAVNGTLRWSASATDTNGNDGPVTTIALADVHVGEDEECGRPPFIRLINPRLGFAVSSPYTLELATSAPAECRLGTRVYAHALLTPLSKTGGLSHTHTLSLTDTSLFISCREESGKLHNKTIRVGVDDTAPVIEATIDPNPILDRTKLVNVTVRVTTDDSSTCAIEGTGFTGTLPPTDPSRPSSFNTTHVRSVDLTTIITNDGRVAIPLTIRCTNLADLTTQTTEELVAHLGADLTITVLEPAEYVARASLLRVRPSKEATCTWRNMSGTTEQPLSVSDGIHAASLPSLADGEHELLILCTGVDASTGTARARFTIDSVPPIADADGPQTLCLGGAAGTYTLNITSKDPDPLVTYTFNGVARNTTARSITIETRNLTPNLYPLRVRATNAANISGIEGGMDIMVAAKDDQRCVAAPNHCIDGIRNADESGVDCGGASCSACIPCVSQTCSGGQTCVENVCVCAVGEQRCGTKCIDITEDPKNCGACGNVCVGACVDSVCAPVNPCANLRLDPGEEGIDCGGVCPGVCVTCTADGMCGSPKTCTNSTCVCPAGEQLCGTTCIDVGSEEANCGACGVACKMGEVCSQGICCGATQSSCAGACTDVTGDADHCGACGASCSAVTYCTGGVCTGCDADMDCTAGQRCVSGTCVVPHCENRVRDVDETGIDCGGSCTACRTCTSDVTCARLESCTDGVCVRTNTCLEELDCSEREDCIEGACVNNGKCLTDQHCTSGMVCDAGDCIEPISCDDMNPCDEGKTCSNGVCLSIPPEGGTPDTCNNGAFDIGETDVDCGGDCLPCFAGLPSDPEPVIPGTPKSHLLSILLIAVGVVLMGGSGYYLYEQHESKAGSAAGPGYGPTGGMAGAPAGLGLRDASPRTLTGSPAVRPLSPPMQAQYEQNPAARAAALEAARKRQAAREEQRKSLLRNFGGADASGVDASSAAAKAAVPVEKGVGVQTDGTPAAKSSDAAAGPADSQTKAAAKTAADKKDVAKDEKEPDVFEELEKIGKR
jgi:hypothetical protein